MWLYEILARWDGKWTGPYVTEAGISQHEPSPGEPTQKDNPHHVKIPLTRPMSGLVQFYQIKFHSYYP
jgi:hypothetical protein